ncbi:hypothetical protein O6H91_15G064200 [Diphasiastrum complanatum]|nr:hypothetical protein O6H91_15G064200 [Diphasiastrum complanatum]
MDSIENAANTGYAHISENAKICKCSHITCCIENNLYEYDLAYGSDGDGADRQIAGCPSDIPVHNTSDCKGRPSLLCESSSTSQGVAFPYSGPAIMAANATDLLLAFPEYCSDFDETDLVTPAHPSSPVGNRAENTQGKIQAELELASVKLFYIAVEMEAATATKGKKLSDDG